MAKTTKTPKTLHDATGVWFDAVLDKPCASDPAVKRVKEMLSDQFAPVTKARFDNLKTTLRGSTCPWKGKVLATANQVSKGAFGKQFRYRYGGAQLGGKVSQSSEFASLLRQALTYPK